MITPNLSLFSNNPNDINLFLSKFYSDKIIKYENQNCRLNFNNPIELVSILSSIIDNNDKYNIVAWINLNEIIKYLYERYPY